MAVGSGRIGPNAILQLVTVLETEIGTAQTARMLALSGIAARPDPAMGLIDEAPVARLHQRLRQDLPDAAARLARAAGARTGDYILAHRIPSPAQWGLRHLPASLSARLLSRAIARHAWTFCGSGEFRVLHTAPPVFAIFDNPVVRGERSGRPLCHWHAAVFETLFQALCGPGWRAVETQCCAQGAASCQFALLRDIGRG
jgi:divinyl protochlorophyllide a 8-vinyl-reductase